MACLVVRVAGRAGCIGRRTEDGLLTSRQNKVYAVNNADPFDFAIKVNNLQKIGGGSHFHFTGFDWFEFAGITSIQHTLFIPLNRGRDKKSGLLREKFFHISSDASKS